MDVVVGEAAEACNVGNTDGRVLDRFSRTIVFLKPELVVVYDRLVATDGTTFEYWLHSGQNFTVNHQQDIQLQVNDVGCRISFLAPTGLTCSQTDQYDPNPVRRSKIREWHLTAATADKARQVEFLVLYRPRRMRQGSDPKVEQDAERGAKLAESAREYMLATELSDGGTATLWLPKHDGIIRVQRTVADGSEVEEIAVTPE